MGKYTYQIKDTVSGEVYVCRHEPEVWDAYGVTFGREARISNVVKGYVASWTFVKEDARWLRDLLIKHGPNRRLRLRVLDSSNLSSSAKVVYEGDIDLTQAGWGSNTFEAPTSEGGFFKALENKWEEKYEIPFDRYCRIDGAVLSDSCNLSGSDSAITANFQRTRALVVDGWIQYATSCKQADFILNARRDGSPETVMQKEFLNDVDMEYVGFEYMDGDTLKNAPTNMTETNAFFVCRSRRVERLTVNYDIKCLGKLVNIKHPSPPYIASRHRLCIYGIPLSRYDSSDGNKPVVWYEYSRRQETSPNSDAYDFTHVSGYVPRYPHDGRYIAGVDGMQFFAVLAECEETVIPKKVTETDENGNFSKKWMALHTATFNGTFELNDFDTLDGKGMAFFLVVDFDIKLGISDDSTFEARTVKNTVGIDFALRLNTGKMIAAIKATDAFRAIIDKISGGRYNVTFNTADFDTAAENDLLTMNEGMKYKSISAHNRRFGLHGSLTTSLSDFLKYAYAVYGFQIGVEQSGTGYVVTLAHFGMMYEKTTVIGTVENYNELEYTVNRDVLYSTLKVGYDFENDTLNGEKEYNNLQVWNTPNTEIEGNELDLTSPYCASSKAIETYLYNNYNTPDDKSREDKDVYLIDAAYSYDYQWGDHGPVHELSRVITALAGITYPDTQWNLKYTPKRMLQAHSLELNSYFALDAGKRITLQTCNFNSSLVSYDGTPPSSWMLVPVAQGGGIQQGLQHGTHYPAGSIVEAEAVTIGTSRVFVPVTAEFNAIAGKEWIEKIEAARLGVIVLNLGNETIRGYIATGHSSVVINPIRANKSTFVILLTDKPTELI